MAKNPAFSEYEIDQSQLSPSLETSFIGQQLVTSELSSKNPIKHSLTGDKPIIETLDTQPITNPLSSDQSMTNSLSSKPIRNSLTCDAPITNSLSSKPIRDELTCDQPMTDNLESSKLISDDRNIGLQNKLTSTAETVEPNRIVPSMSTQACTCPVRKTLTKTENSQSVDISNNSQTANRRKLYPSCDSSLERSQNNGYLPIGETIGLASEQQATNHGARGTHSQPATDKYESDGSSIEDMLVSQEDDLMENLIESPIISELVSSDV